MNKKLSLLLFFLSPIITQNNFSMAYLARQLGECPATIGRIANVVNAVHLKRTDIKTPRQYFDTKQKEETVQEWYSRNLSSHKTFLIDSLFSVIRCQVTQINTLQAHNKKKRLIITDENLDRDNPLTSKKNCTELFSNFSEIAPQISTHVTITNCPFEFLEPNFQHNINAIYPKSDDRKYQMKLLNGTIEIRAHNIFFENPELRKTIIAGTLHEYGHYLANLKEARCKYFHGKSPVTSVLFKYASDFKISANELKERIKTIRHLSEYEADMATIRFNDHFKELFKIFLLSEVIKRNNDLEALLNEQCETHPSYAQRIYFMEQYLQDLKEEARA